MLQGSTEWRLLLSLAIQDARRLIVAAALLMLSGALVLVNPLLASQLAESVIDSGIDDRVLHILLGWFVLVAVQNALSFVGTLQAGVVAESLYERLRSELFATYQSLPIATVQRYRRGPLLSLFSNDANVISLFISTTLPSVLPQLLVLIGAFVMLLTATTAVALLVLLGVLAFAVPLKLISRRLRALSRSTYERYASLLGYTEENLSHLALIKTYGIEAQRYQDFSRWNRDYADSRIRMQRLQAGLSPMARVVGGTLLLGFAGLLLTRPPEERLPVDQLVAVVVYGFLMIRPAANLASLYGRLQNTLAASRRLQQFLSEESENYARGEPNRFRVSRGVVEFQGVAFAFPGRTPVLRHLDATFSPGALTAITGANGAGKSTMADLLLRFESPGQGRILVDGQNIADYPLADVRRQIGYVRQHTQLLDATIRQNLLIGRADATDADLWSALDSVSATFVRALSDGLDTPVGSDGQQLSGGEQQKLAIARALLRSPRILVLDEATSMIDRASERHFLEHCRHALIATTIVLISHRDHPVDQADRHVELVDGRLVPVASEDVANA